MLDRRTVQNINWWLILAAVIMSLIGLMTVYAATAVASPQNLAAYRTQLRSVAIAFASMLLIMTLDYKRLVKAAYSIHLFAIILLLLVLFIAEPIAGVRRWLNLGFLTFQPSELAKVTSILALAKLFSAEELKQRPWFQILGGLIIIAIPALLVIKQPDFGTAVTFLIPFLALAFVAQERLKPLCLTLLAGLISAIPGWFMLKDYQKTRILAFLNPSYDELGSGYQAIQSKIGIGSGGVMGKGFWKSTQVRLQFLPARHTDFIFSVYAEEHGFLGSLVLILLFLLLLTAAFSIAFKARDMAGSLLAVGCATLIGVQFLVNIGMVIGLLPITGLPLPFMSYGGSSMITLFMMLGLLESVQMRRFAF